MALLQEVCYHYYERSARAMVLGQQKRQISPTPTCDIINSYAVGLSAVAVF
jgi:hypothetical protein